MMITIVSKQDWGKKMKNRIRGSVLIFGVALLATAGSSMAATSILDNSQNGSLTVTGYSNTGTAGALAAVGEKAGGCSTSNTASGCAAQLNWYAPSTTWDYGYGIASNSGDTAAPAHAIDNVGNIESLLLNFGTSTKLQSVTVGYTNTDSDITVLAWKGVGDPTSTGALGGVTYGGLIGKGWVLVGNYSDLLASSPTSEKPQAVNAAGVSSSYWLVMAYNSVFGTVNSGTVGAGTNSGLNGGNDYVKFYSVAYTTTTTTTTNKVSEPSSALLFGAGLLGLMGWRARKQAAK